MPFLFGLAAAYILLQPNLWHVNSSAVVAILIEVCVFVLASFLGCFVSPTRPFSAAVGGIVGVFVGVILDIIIHPTVSGGYERNLFPLEIAAHTIIAIPSFLLGALAWKVGMSLTQGKKQTSRQAGPLP